MSFTDRFHAQRAALGRRALITLAFNTLVALALWRSDVNSRFVVHWVYSQAIGLSIWAGIDIGRLAFADAGRGFPPGWRAPALVVGGIIAGLWSAPPWGTGWRAAATRGGPGPPRAWWESWP